MTEKGLVNKAIETMHNAYAPYSGFFVGAALLCRDGRVYCGCNIENSSYPAGVCAERAAVSAAVSCGSRDFVSVAIVGGKNGKVEDFCTPCGICRQVLSEFANEDFEIILYDGENIKKYRLPELLPFGFGRKNL